MRISKRTACGMGLLFALFGCATNEQGQTVLDPEKVNGFIGQILNPAAGGDDSSTASSKNDDDGDDYSPQTTDQYVRDVSDKDIQVVNGNTYVSVVDASGHRHRVFYGHGDQHLEVMQRHAELQRVMAHNGGSLPAHPVRSDGSRVKALTQSSGSPGTGHVQRTSPSASQPNPGVRTVSAPAMTRSASSQTVKPAVAPKTEKSDKTKKVS